MINPRSLVGVLVCGLMMVACKGENDGGEALAETPDEVATPPDPILDPSDAIAITRGHRFACALQRAGRVACWGQNDEAQLGQPHHDQVMVPVHVDQLDDATAIAAAQASACAVRAEGRVSCWGNRTVEFSDAGEVAMKDVTDIPPVTAIWAGQGLYCAKASDATWCWAEITSNPPSRHAWRDRKPSKPWKLALGPIRALQLGWRNYAFLEDGTTVAWGGLEPQSEPSNFIDVPDTVDALSRQQEDCLVRPSGEVRFLDRPTESLRGAGDLVWVGFSGIVAGILPDGTLAVRGPRAEPPTFVDGRELIALAGTQHEEDLLALTRNGRVLRWQQDSTDASRYLSSEIGLPAVLASEKAPKSARSTEVPVAEDPVIEKVRGPMPHWCSIETRVATASVSNHTWVCKLHQDTPSDCMDRREPWFAIDQDWTVALMMPMADGRARWLSGLAEQVEGEQEASLSRNSAVWSRYFVLSRAVRLEGHVDAWLLMARLREDSLTHLLHVVVTDLNDDVFLITEVLVDVSEAKSAGGKTYDGSGDEPAVDVVLAGNEIDVWACGGYARLPMPEYEKPSVAEPSAAEPSLPPASAVEVAAARKRCNEGWAKFESRDTAGAKIDVDAALDVLERSGGEDDRRGFGACLYNRGRIAEDEGDDAKASEYYERSLAVRPNDVVQARLDSLE